MDLMIDDDSRLLDFKNENLSEKTRITKQNMFCYKCSFSILTSKQ